MSRPLCRTGVRRGVRYGFGLVSTVSASVVTVACAAEISYLKSYRPVSEPWPTFNRKVD
jgi:hypothetical protein